MKVATVFGVDFFGEKLCGMEGGAEDEQGQSEVGVRHIRKDSRVGRDAGQGAQGEGAAHSVPGAVVLGQRWLAQARAVAQVLGAGGG